MTMPIKAENRGRYPADWPAISLAARMRACWVCLHPGCLAQQYAVGWWRSERRGYVWAPEWPRDGAYIGQTYRDAREVAAGIYAAQGESGQKPLVIVLTVAHLNHQPEDCRPENLAAMCQRHHLASDQEHHQRNAWATRRARSANLELFA
jgi:hypothetical protein